ncbi:MAG: TonB-dependent receptor plug domain-containing protein [Bacteroidia bacterium]
MRWWSRGYGTMQKSDVTGAIVSVRVMLLYRCENRSTSWTASQGRVPGVEISRDNGRAGSDFDLLVRGRRSLNATNAPLVLVDGVPYGDNIDINPADIESIEIMERCFLYCDLWFARRQRRCADHQKGIEGRSQISFNTYYGIAEAFQSHAHLRPDGFIQQKIDANKDINDWATEPNPLNVFPSVMKSTAMRMVLLQTGRTVTRQGSQQDYHLVFTGGNKTTTYSTSLNYFREKG